MRVLVTGGAGFIGSHLVDHHVAAGDEVVVLDDLSTGRVSNLAHHPPGRVTFLEGAVEDRPLLERAFADVDLVYHMAAVVGVLEVIRRPLRSLTTNLHSTEAVFEQALRRQTRVVFASTSEVYGKNTKVPLRETDDGIYGSTAVARWLYAVSKAADEFMALAYAREHGLPVTTVRLFNTTGPRQSGSYGMVVPRFIRRALLEEPIQIYGDGSQTRCFTNVFDVVRALTSLAATHDAIGVVVNVGQPDEISIRELAERVRTACDSSSSIENLDYESAYGPGFEDMRRRVPDVTLLRKLIGFAPETPLETTLRQMITVTRDELGMTPTTALADGAATPDPSQPDGRVTPAA
jgi:UDP-glucose 4-epimerase